MGLIQDRLTSHLHRLDGPFLFIGSGVSRRFADLPNWEGLLREFAARTPHSLEYYRGASAGDFGQMASGIAENFYDLWWSDSRYADSRAAHSGDINSQDSPLKVEISAFLNELLEGSAVPPPLQQEWDAFKSVTVDGVITTNYDRLIERVFPDFKVFVGQDELLFAPLQGIAEIYKIHGSIDRPNSLVLTAADYADFRKRNPYLAAKLLTLFVEHPVIFLGYRLADANVQEILRNLVVGLKQENIDKLQQRLIFVEWQKEVEPSFSDTVLQIEGMPLPITRLVVPDFLEVFRALEHRKRAIPARVVRLLKQQLYDIVLTNDPKERLVAYTDIDSASAQNVEVIFGVGAKFAAVGIRGLTRLDLWQDVLSAPDRKLPAHDIVENFYSRMQPGWWLPIFKYLDEAGHLDDDGQLRDRGSIDSDIVKRFDRAVHGIETTAASVSPKPARMKPIDDLRSEYGAEIKILANAFKLPAYTRDLDGLRSFLAFAMLNLNLSQPEQTHLARGVVVYDYLKYGPGRALFKAPR